MEAPKRRKKSFLLYLPRLMRPALMPLPLIPPLARISTAALAEKGPETGGKGAGTGAQKKKKKGKKKGKGKAKVMLSKRMWLFRPKVAGDLRGAQRPLAP